MQTALPFQSEASFWDKIAPKYAKKPIADPAAYERKLTRIRSLLRPEDRVLEIGCGTGSTALNLASAVAKITATDISPAMVSIAESKRVDASISNVEFQNSAADERLENEPYDVVMAFSILHLVDDVPEVLDAVFAQTRPGGLFISKTVCLGDSNAVLRLFVRALSVFGLAPKVTMLSREGLRQMLIRAGFDLLESHYLGKGRLNPFIVAQRPN